MKRLDEIVPDRAVFPYASGRRRSAPRLQDRAHAVLGQHFPRGPQRRRSADGEAHVSERAPRAALRDQDVKGDRFQRVELADSTRWGLLGKGAVLMAAAYPNRTSPVLRGSFILEHIAGAPPAHAAARTCRRSTRSDMARPKAQTVRDMMAKHRENPACCVVPRHHGSAWLRARELRRDRRAGATGSLRGRADRFGRQLPDGTRVTARTTCATR